jgi:hypothetical protein
VAPAGATFADPAAQMIVRGMAGAEKDTLRAAFEQAGLPAGIEVPG